LNEEVELLKVKVLADYFHNWFRFLCSAIASGLVGLAVALVSLYFQQRLTYLDYIVSLVVLFVMAFSAFVLIAIRPYRADLSKIDALLMQVEKGESLPSLRELRKMREPRRNQNPINKAETDKKGEIVELLKQISSKLDVSGGKKEDKDFQLDMLKIQVVQTNAVMFLTIAVSVAVSFYVSFVVVSLTVDIPREILDILWKVLASEVALLVVLFAIIWLILNYLLVGKIDKLRPKKNENE
jgi:hypothetical protein